MKHTAYTTNVLRYVAVGPHRDLVESMEMTFPDRRSEQAVHHLHQCSADIVDHVHTYTYNTYKRQAARRHAQVRECTKHTYSTGYLLLYYVRTNVEFIGYYSTDV